MTKPRKSRKTAIGLSGTVKSPVLPPTLTFDLARGLLIAKHRRACLRIHELVVSDRATTNADWKELVDARKGELEACGDLFRLNWCEGDAEKLNKDANPPIHPLPS